MNSSTNLPMFPVRKDFPRPVVPDVEAKVYEELSRATARIKPGMRVALAVGSRGIANLSRIVGATAAWVRGREAEPFVVPAMGSHGGATARGQEELLASYGVSKEGLGVPVRSSMDVVELDSGGLAHPLYFDREAAKADATIVINRAKLHTDFHGPVESGLLKMCVIGLGKHRQALAMHSFGVRGLRDMVGPAARKVLDQSNIVAGVGIAENAYDETARIRVALAEDFEVIDSELLAFARSHMPSLPTDDMDLLIVDEMGKDISGVGIDPNIVGRVRVPGEPEPDSPRARAVVVCRLTPASHGNAIGVGLADVVTRELFESIDYSATRENVATSTFLERGKIPLIAETEREAYEIALRACHLGSDTSPRVVRIRNTLHPGAALVSAAVRESLLDHETVRAGARGVPLLRKNGTFSDACWQQTDTELWSF